MTAANPFTSLPIDDDRYLIGRQAFVAELEQQMARGPVVLRGGKRTGKTSLLLHLERKHAKNAAEKWLFWSAEELKGGGGLDAAEQLYGLAGEGGLRGMLERNVRVVILFDEFDALRHPDYGFSPTDFQRLRGLATRFGRRFGLLLASSRELNNLGMPGSDLVASMCYKLNLGALEVGAPIEFYAAYLAAAGAAERLEAQKTHFSKACEFAGFHPWLLQVAGEAAAAARDSDDYFRLVRSQETRVESIFRHVWETLSEAEQTWFVVALNEAVPEGMAGDEETYVAAGLRSHGVTPGAFKLAVMSWFAESCRSVLGAAVPASAKVLLRNVAGKSAAEASRFPGFLDLVSRRLVRFDGGRVVPNLLDGQME